MKRYGILAVATSAMIFAGCSMVNKPAPNFTLTALDGSKVSLADFKGKPVVLSFFAGW